MITVALCVVAHDRPTELDELLASVASEPFDEIVVLDNSSRPPLESRTDVTWLRRDENLGVPGARNVLASTAGSDVLVFVDDDAVVCGAAADAVRARFEFDAMLGALAFRIQRPDGHIESLEWPFRGVASDTGISRRCAYFVGCGYAVRRHALEAVGGYDEDFFYSTEEIDLATQLIKHGWHLRYEPDVLVEHRPSSQGREVRPAVPGLRLRNRLVFARRHLPWLVAVVHVAAWGLRTLIEAVRARSLLPWLRGWREGLVAPVERRPLSFSDALRIHALGGRVWW